MKNKLLILTTLLLLNLCAFAQKEITVMAVTKKMSHGIQPGFMVNVPEGKLKDVGPALEKKLEENTKASVKEVVDEMVIYGAYNKNFSSKPYIAYAKLLETTEGVEVNAFITEDSITFISDTGDADKVAAIKKFLHDFGVEEYKKVIGKQLKIETEKADDLKKTLEKQMKEENENTQDIGKKQREIENYNSQIEANKVKQSTKDEQVGAQQKLIDGISDKKSPEYNLGAKNLKKYEGEKKALQKDAEKLARNIEENQAEIKLLEQKNEDQKKQQEDTKKKIDEQSEVVKGVETILKGIN